MLAEGERRPVDDLNDRHTFGQMKSRLQRVGETPLDPFLADQPVDHHLDGVLEIPVELDLLGEFPHLTVDASPGEPLAG